MRNIFKTTGRWLSDVIDFFYPPFRKFMTLQFFRYGVTGSANLVFDWVLYFVIYNFVLQQQMLSLGFVTLSSHVASFAIKFPIVLMTGFLLQKYVTFSHSEMRGHVQLFRYLIVFLVNLLISFVGLKFLVEWLRIYPTISNMLMSIITVFISYFSQKKYTFKVMTS